MADLDDPSRPGLLFVYGTLMPVDPDAEPGIWSSDSVRGRLYDLGAHPGLVDLDDPSAGAVEGFVRPVGLAELRERLDPYEGVAEGLFRRVACRTLGGRAAWIYVYARPLPGDARGPIPRWDGLRGVFGIGPSPDGGRI